MNPQTPQLKSDLQLNNYLIYSNIALTSLNLPYMLLCVRSTTRLGITSQLWKFSQKENAHTNSTELATN